MIKQVLLSSLIGFSCPKTKVVNETNKWTKADQNALEYVSQDCKHKYKDAPCLKSFTKKEESVYRAICGEKEKQ